MYSSDKVGIFPALRNSGNCRDTSLTLSIYKVNGDIFPLLFCLILLTSLSSVQSPVITGGLEAGEDKKILTQFVFWSWTLLMTRWAGPQYPHSFNNKSLQVFLLLWWWFYLLALLGLVRVLYRLTQCRSVQPSHLTSEGGISLFVLFIIMSVFGKDEDFSLFRSAMLRFKLLDIRLNRFLRRSKNLEKIKQFIVECKLGDW